MYQIQIKSGLGAAVATTGASSAIITESTLIPLGIYVAGIFLVCIVSYRLSSLIVKLMMTIQKFEDTLSRHEGEIADQTRRLVKLEKHSAV